MQLYKTVNSETKEPLVSVIMPCYKMGRFIGEALESVGKQSYLNWEVLAVDDCGVIFGNGCYPEPRKVGIKNMSCKLAELQEKCQLCFRG